MNATTNAPAATVASAQTDWTSFAPALPVIPEARFEAFFETAPSATVVEVDGELFMRGNFRNWSEMEYILSAGDDFYSSAEHNQRTPEEMVSLASSPRVEVRVMRIGEPVR